MDDPAAMPACPNRATVPPRRRARQNGVGTLGAAWLALHLPLTAAAEPRALSSPPTAEQDSPLPAAEAVAQPRAPARAATPRGRLPIRLPPSEDKALAEALFQRGLAEMRRGRFAEACSALEQSQAIEFGIGTMLYLAECYEYQGRTASAWAMFRDAAAAARAEGQQERAKMGSARAARLEPQLSRLAVHVPTINALPGLLVLRDGQPMPRAAWDVALPADPGPVQIEARAVDRLSWQATVQVPANGAVLSVDVPLLEAAPKKPAPPALAAQLPSESATLQPAEAAPAAALQRDADRASWQKPLGLSIGAAGLTGVAVGTYFGLRAISKNEDLERACPEVRCGASAQGSALSSEAHSAARVANVFVIGGAVLFVSGALIFLSAPSGESAELAVQAAAGGGGIELRGRM